MKNTYRIHERIIEGVSTGGKSTGERAGRFRLARKAALKHGIKVKPGQTGWVRPGARKGRVASVRGRIRKRAEKTERGRLEKHQGGATYGDEEMTTDDLGISQGELHKSLDKQERAEQKSKEPRSPGEEWKGPRDKPGPAKVTVNPDVASTKKRSGSFGQFAGHRKKWLKAGDKAVKRFDVGQSDAGVEPTKKIRTVITKAGKKEKMSGAELADRNKAEAEHQETQKRRRVIKFKKSGKTGKKPASQIQQKYKEKSEKERQEKPKPTSKRFRTPAQKAAEKKADDDYWINVDSDMFS